MDIVAELRRLARDSATGRLDVHGPHESGWIGLSEGRIGTVSLSTAHPALGMRLVSDGSLSVSELGAALNVQRQQPDMRLGDVVVRMGLVSREQIESVAWEQMCDQMLTLLKWAEQSALSTNFTPMPQSAVAPGGPSVEELLDAARSRSSSLQQIVRRIGGTDTVPALTNATLHNHDVVLRPMDWAVLCRIDGRRSLQQIGEQAGLTTLEAASILQGLIAAGVAEVRQTHLAAPPNEPDEQPASPVPQPTAPIGFDDPSELLRELSQLGGGDAMSHRHTHH